MHKSKIRITLILIVLLSILAILSSVVKAADNKYTATSTINGVTVNWSYELNETDEIINLKCTNPAEVTGNITIPSNLDGKTVVTLGNHAFESAIGITEVTIPSSVKEIGLWAFRDCTNLSSINLGSVEEIAGYAFKGCTSLTSVKIPKTLKSTGLDQPVFAENLNTITFEEGLTIIPQALCAETKITEVTIPSSVKKIDLWAFRDCINLEKITILDNVIDMSDSLGNDEVFKNHNSELTIYCYEDSVAAKYAIKHNIKYVYLTKPVTDNGTGDNKNTNEDNKNTNESNKNTTVKDSTTANGKLPQAGLSIKVFLVIVVLIVGGVVFYFKYNKLKII